MVHTYSDNDKIYSVDMMIAYVNIFECHSKTILVEDYVDLLKLKCWRKNSKKYTPLDVLNNPELYEYDYEKIINADVNYPVIIHDNNIIDGMHRLSNAYMMGRKHLKAYIFNDDLIKKFLIDKKGNYSKIKSLKIHDFIELFYKKFK